MNLADLAKGIAIILRYQPNTVFDGHSGTLFCGEYKPEQMTLDDVAMLEQLGWHEDEDSWALSI